MQVLIPVNQAACVRAGIDAPKSTVLVEIDPAQLPQDERDLLASLLVDGHKVVVADHSDRGRMFEESNRAFAGFCPPTPEGLRAKLRQAIERGIELHAAQSARIAEQEARRRKDLEERVARALAAPLSSWVFAPSFAPGSPTPVARLLRAPAGIDGVSGDPRIVARHAELAASAELAALLADHAVKAAAARELAEREAQAKSEREARREAQLAAWFEEHATEQMRKRKERNLLPREAIVTAMANHAFAGLSEADFPRYVRPADEVVWDEIDVDDGEVRIDVQPAKAASDAALATMERIEAALPGCTTTLHDYWYDTEDSVRTANREVVTVERRIGDWLFTSKFAVPE